MSDLLESASKLFEKEKQNCTQTGRKVGIQLKPSIWDLISGSVPAQEIEEVKSIIGTTLLQDNKDLRQEMNALIEILAEVQASNDGREQKLSGLSSLSLNSAERQLVEQEIQMLVDNFQRHGEMNGVDGDSYLSKTIVEPATPREKSIISYVTNGRPSSASSRPMTSRSSRPATSKSLPSSRDTQTEVEEVKPFISVFKMDSIVSRVQEMLKVEQEELQSDVDYLQRCIEEEMDFGLKADNDPSSVLQVPSTSELREYGSKLKTKWLQDEQLNDQKLLVQRGPNQSVLSEVRPPMHQMKPDAASGITKERKVKKNSTPKAKTRKRRDKTQESKSNVQARREPTPPLTPPTVSTSVFNFTGVGDGQQAPSVGTPNRPFRSRAKKTIKSKKKAEVNGKKAEANGKKSRVRNRLLDARDLDKELTS